ncbi:MAG TPA: hypothetical protein PLH07_00515 [Sulfurovum sp.]|jgi:hypothetical protein|nr:hypothetical protein [Sulfurovum sp.]HQS71745.1 hypothetical protein [Sulfurovum sp.]HQS76733.1 hypothetical protein [Sulfurovum sp.]HQT27763.1 hypothetical protein [Sulfurovum sp.]
MRYVLVPLFVFLATLVVVGIIDVPYGVGWCGGFGESVFAIILIAIGTTIDKVTVTVIGECCTVLFYELVIVIIDITGELAMAF